MYAHVNTYRFGEESEVNAELEAGLVISDQTARTIASWWHSPLQEAIKRLSHGMPFDTDDLAREIDNEIADLGHAEAMHAWLDHLVAHLQG